MKSRLYFDTRQRLCINMIISVFFLIVSSVWMKNNKHLPFQIETVVNVYWLFFFGFYFKQFKKNYKSFTAAQNMFIFALSFCMLLYFDRMCRYNNWNSNVNIFENPFMFVATSLSGFFAVFSVSELFSLFKHTKLLEYIGKHTLSILLFHFLSFKIVTLIQLFYYHESFYRLASFPVFHFERWWIVYTLVGITIPLCLEKIAQESVCLLKKITVRERYKL